MKKLLFVFALNILLTGIINAQEPTTETKDNSNLPVIEFVTKTIDYGKIDKGADGSREFEFKNAGKEPLIISSCKGSSN